MRPEGPKYVDILFRPYRPRAHLGCLTRGDAPRCARRLPLAIIFCAFGAFGDGWAGQLTSRWLGGLTSWRAGESYFKSSTNKRFVSSAGSMPSSVCRLFFILSKCFLTDAGLPCAANAFKVSRCMSSRNGSPAKASPAYFNASAQLFSERESFARAATTRADCSE